VPAEVPGAVSGAGPVVGAPDGDGCWGPGPTASVPSGRASELSPGARRPTIRAGRAATTARKATPTTTHRARRPAPARTTVPALTTAIFHREGCSRSPAGPYPARVTDLPAAAPAPADGIAALCRFLLLARTALVVTTAAAAVLITADPWPTVAAAALAAGWSVAGGVALARRPGLTGHPVPLLAADLAVAAGILAIAGAGPVFLAVSCTSAALSGAACGVRSAPVWAGLTAVGYVLTALILRSLTPAGSGAGGAGGGTVAVHLTAVPPLHVLAGLGASAARSAVLRQLALAAAAMAAIERSAIAGERGRMARELHDSVAQTLRGLSFAAVALPASLVRRPELAGELAGTVARAAQTAADEARDLLDTLRADDGGTPLADVVRQACAAWSDRTGLPVQGDLHPLEVAVDVRHELLRILREALNNVERHARASAVRVDLQAGRGAVHLSVRDDGVGFAVPDDARALAGSGHYGLIGMAERAARVGGTLHVTSRASGGTAVVARVPPAAPATAATPAAQPTRAG